MCQSRPMHGVAGMCQVKTWFHILKPKGNAQRKDIQGQDRTQKIRKKRLYQKTYMYFINQIEIGSG